MTKTVSLTYGDLILPSNVVMGNVSVSLVNNTGQPVQTIHVPYETPSVDFTVTSGTGWKFSVLNGDSAGNSLTAPVETAPFDVVETQTVKVVTSASIA